MHWSYKKSRLSVFSAFLTHECVCWGLVDKRGLNLCDVRAGSSAVGLQQASLLQIVQIITVHVTARPNQRQTVSAWANHVGSMLLKCLDSDADASVVVVLLQWLN